MLASVDGPNFLIVCDQCGRYAIRRQLAFEDNSSATLSHWIREQNDLGAPNPILYPELLDELTSLSMPSFTECADYLLVTASKASKGWGGFIRSDDRPLHARAYALKTEDFINLCNYNVERKFFREFTETSPHPHAQYRLTASGIVRVGELARPNLNSDKAFLGLWYSNPLVNETLRGLEVGTDRAGFRPIVIKNIEHSRDINDVIVSELEQSRFSVCDLTGERCNVYFEAGFSMGLNLQTILTCRKNDTGKEHFNLRQFNCIEWENAQDLAEQLTRRIGRVVGFGPHWKGKQAT